MSEQWQDNDEVVITFKTLKQTQKEAFQDGVRYALQYLKDEVFGEEITKTSIWEEHFGTEAEDNK